MKKEIKAIYNEDMEGFLEKTGELYEIKKGNRFCKICGGAIMLNNIQLIVPYKNQSFEYICDSISCVEQYNGN
jgi:hypothetical protein